MQNPTVSQTPDPAVAVPVQAPEAPPAPRAAVITSEGGRAITVEVPGVMTVEDVRGLQSRRSELDSQLRDAQQQRREVAAELGAADPAAKAGLEARLKVIDDRIVQIETDITATGKALTSVPAGVAMAAQRQEQIERNARNNGDEEESFFLGSFVTAAFISVVLLFRRWRRKRRQPKMEALSGLGTERFTRLEQAVDAIAVEVERISEGQRFQAKLMAETHERTRRDAMAKDVAGGY